MKVIYYYYDVCKDLAKEFSLQNKLEVLSVNSFDELLIKVDDNFIIIISPELINETLLMNCYKLQYEKNYNFGVITGLSLEIIKNKLDNYKDELKINTENPYFVFRTINDKIDHELQAEVLTRYDINTSIVKEKLMNKNIVISAMMDGSRMHLQINDGLICGINQDIEENEIKKVFHSCFSDGKLGCCDNLIFACKINSESIFLNSCSSSLIGTSKHGTYSNIVMNLLKNSKSIISGYRPKEGFASENLLYYLLLKQGYNLGEILYILNINSYNHCTDYFPYILFGFPNSLAISEEQEEVNLSNDWNLLDNEIKIKAQANFKNCIVSILSFENNYDLFEKICQRNFDVSSNIDFHNDIYYSIIPYKNSRRVKIIFYTWKLIKEDIIIKIDFSNRNTLLTQTKIRYENLQKLESLSFRHKKLQNQIHEYLKNSSSLIQNEKSHRRNLYNKKFKSTISLINNTEKVIVDYLIEDLRNQGNKFFIERYGKDILIECADHIMHNNAKCPYCGGNLYLKKGENPILDINRLSAFCSLCHNVYDVPYEVRNSIEKLIYPKISLIEKHSEKVRFSIKLKNEKEYSTINTVYFGIWAEQNSYVQFLDIEHIRADFELNSKDEKEILLLITLNDNIQNMIAYTYCLYVYWFEDFDIYVSTHMFNLSNIIDK